MVAASSILDRVLVLEMVRVTEAAAIAAAKLVGRGDEKAADRIYALQDIAKGDCIFAATGVTDGSLLKGVKRLVGGCVTTESIVMRASSGTVRRVVTEHRRGVA